MKDIFNSIGVILLSLFVYFYSKTFEVTSNGNAANPAHYPQNLALILGILGIVLLVNTLRRKDFTKPTINKNVVIGISKIFGLLGAYLVGMLQVGYPISTAIFILISIILLGGSRSTALKLFLPITIVLYVMFFVVFKIPVPTGQLFR